MQKRDATDWNDTGPDSDGMWWFYGELDLGCMGMHLRPGYKVQPRLDLVEVDSRMPFISGGNMWSKEKFNGTNVGWLGFWQKVELPSTEGLAVK